MSDLLLQAVVVEPRIPRLQLWGVVNFLPIEALQQRNYIEEHRNVIESEKQAANTSSNIESVALNVGNAYESVGNNVANIRASDVGNCLTIQDECCIL